MKTATGDSARRTVVSSAKCAKCHEWFEGHGGNRVYEVQVCVVCHVPNLSTSGRGADPATVLARLDIADAANGDPAGTSAAALTAAGYNPADPTTYPEESNNLKDMIHGIHAGEKRAAAGAPYRFVRDRGTSGVYYYDWSEVKFPGLLNYCEMCHNPGTYGETPANALATTNKTKDAGGIFTKTVPNATDLVTTPLPATCISCHGYGNDATAAHMTANGVGTANNILRSALPGVTQCVLCHTNHKIAAPAVVHGDDE